MPKASVPVNDRTAVKAEVSDMPAEPDDFDAAMTQSRDRKPAEADDAKTAPDAAVAKAPSGQAESAPMRLPQETQVARSALPQESQPATTPINFATQAQAPLSQLQAATGQAVEKLTPRVGSPGWDQALGQKVVWMVAGEQQSASLTLNPPDLGPLQVVLEVSNNQATASFTSAQPEVRQALESAMPKLREMLGEAGIQLGQANVSAGTPNNQQSGFGEQQQGSRGFDSRKESDDTPARVTRSQPITGGQGLVDTFA
jgi:flagellar hook-length control protein FliK